MEKNENISKALEVVRAVRKSKGLRQSDVAAMLGIGVRAYRAKEGGNLRVGDLVAICSVLGLNIVIVEKERVL